MATQRAVAESSPRIRVAINTGVVIDTSTGPIGGAVNAAARIAGRAAGGEILVSDVVRQLVGVAPSIAFIDRGRQRLKGFADRWHLWQATDASTGGPDHGTIGRVDEFFRLQGFVSSLVAGAGRPVALEGEAGIGKTHLVREVSRMARSAGAQVVVVVADEVTRVVAAGTAHGVARPVVDSVVDSGGGHLRLGALDDVDLHALSAAITGAAPGPQLRERLRGNMSPYTASWTRS